MFAGLGSMGKAQTFCLLQYFHEVVFFTNNIQCVFEY